MKRSNNYSPSFRSTQNPGYSRENNTIRASLGNFCCHRYCFHVFSGLLKPKISTNCESPIIGGDSARPPEPPLRFAIVLYYLLWNYRSRGDATAAGAEALRAVAQKER